MPQSPTARDGKITRELVLATALEIIDRDGADALSMRRFRAAPERDPMVLYRHAPGKAALLDDVVETVPAQLSVDPADPDWTARLRAVARDYRALALAHPNVVPPLVTRPLATPLALRPRGGLPLSEFPLLRGLAHALACYDGAAELERGLDILIAGLAATLSLPGPGRPPGLAAHDASGDLTDGAGER